MPNKNSNVYRTLGARCNLKIMSAKLTEKQREWLKIIMDYKKSCGCFWK